MGAKELFRSIDSDTRRGVSMAARKAWSDAVGGAESRGARWARSMDYAAWLRHRGQVSRAQDCLTWIADRKWRWDDAVSVGL